MKLRFVVLGALIAVAAFGQWEAESRVTTNVSTLDATTTGNARAVAMRGDTVHVVYHEGSMFSSIVYYCRSVDRGQTWQSPVQLSAGGTWNNAQFGCIALRGATVHTAWFDLDMVGGQSRILYRRSTNSGTTWSSAITVTSTGTLNEVPSLSYSGDTVHLVWDDAGSVLYYRRSTDNGASWPGSSTSIATSAATGAVAAAGSTVLVSYSVGSGSAWDIYLKRSSDGGATWSSAMLIENRGTLADISSLAIRGSNAWVAWYDNGSGTNDVRVRHSTDAGATWASAVDLGAGSGNQEAPCLLVTPSNVLHAVYDDDSYGNYEISYRYSTDLGTTWSAATRLTSASNTSQRGTLALTGADSVGVVWTDGRYSESYPDVFFRRGRTPVLGDVGCTRILAPTGNVDSGASVTPACSVYNYGTTTETYNVRMRIGSLYNQVTQVSGHAPGTYQYVTFASWAALPRGTLAVTCSTELGGDGTPSNDKQTGTVTVAVRDVGTIVLLAPSGTIDSGAVLTPACSVRNFGTAAAGYWVKMQIGTGYRDSTYVSGHAAGTARYVSFTNWTALPRGSLAVSCSTALAADMKTSNDRLGGTVTVVVRDVGTVSLLAPSGTVDTGAVATPACSVRNWGTDAASYWVRMKIGARYLESTYVSGHASGSARYATFPNWTALERGNLAVNCSTALAADLKTSNDRLTGSVFVRVIDAQAVSIDAPPMNVDSGTPNVPRATARNAGTNAASFDVRFGIGAWASTKSVSLGPGAQTSVAFDTWTPGQRGTYTIRCTTMLQSDMNSSNDLQLRDVTVAVHDAGAVAVLAPADTILPGPVQPRATVRNYGSTREPLKVFFYINSAPAYRESTVLGGGLPSAETTLAFPDWNAVAGTFTGRCSTALNTDQNHANDRASAAFLVAVPDIGVDAITVPVGFFDTGSTVVPAARLHNYGGAPASLRCWFVLRDPGGNEVYRQSVDVAVLNPDADTALRFPGYNVGRATGDWTTRCSTYCAGDAQPANDFRDGGFRVAAGQHWPPGWVEVDNVPTGPSGRPVKDGGWVAADPGASRLYVVKGNKTFDFYAYNPYTGVWTAPAPVPPGAEGRPCYKGAAACSDGNGRLYATKGNNTLGFWTYDADGDSWRQRADVPLGSTNKRVKGGTDLVYAANGCVYLLKGYRNEFLKYVPAADSWHALPDAPVGASVKWDKGSWLAHDGAHTVFAHKAKYHELEAFDTNGDTWLRTPSRQGMPYTGANGRKKSKDGGSGAYYDGALYALKGGNTQEFWRYRIQSDSWQELDTMPAVGSSGRRKKVKAGGNITDYGNGAFFALKGNKTVEFWRYVVYYEAGQAPARRDGVAASSFIVPRSSFIVSPNPLTGAFATVFFTGPLESSNPRILLTVFDVTGRAVLKSSFVTRHSPFALDLRSMPAGVYMVKLSGEGFAQSQKLVLQR